MTFKADKQAAEKEIKAIIRALCAKYDFELLDIVAEKKTDYQHCGVKVTGEVHLVLGAS